MTGTRVQTRALSDADSTFQMHQITDSCPETVVRMVHMHVYTYL